MTDSASPSPLELDSFTPPRRAAGTREIVSPLNGAVMSAPGPGMTPRPDRDEAMAKIVRGLSNGLSLPGVLKILVEEGHEPVEPFLVHRWRHRYPLFNQAYDLARAVGAHALLDEVRSDVDGADDKETAYIARVKSEAKLKLAEKWAPERFGPRVAPGSAVQVVINTTLPQPGDDQPTDGFRVKAQPLAAASSEQCER